MKRLAMFIMAVLFAFTLGADAVAGEAAPGTPAAPAAKKEMGKSKAAKKRVRKIGKGGRRRAAKKPAKSGEQK